MPQSGRVLHIHLAQVARAPVESVQGARAIAGLGLEGDRHAQADSQRQVLLMDIETLSELDLQPGMVKENITTHGLRLTSLMAGQRVHIGHQVVLEVTVPCQPCENMDAVRPGLREALEGKRGVLARVLRGGPFKVNDPIRVEG